MLKLIIFEAITMGLIFGLFFQSIPAIIAGLIIRIAILLLARYFTLFAIISKIIDFVFSLAYGIIVHSLTKTFLGGWALVPAIIVGFGTFAFRWYFEEVVNVHIVD